MLANILVVAILLVWSTGAIAFVCKNAKEAVVNHNLGCVGCSQGCSSSASKHCSR
ncbi:hypothetical protein BGX16_0705 [Hallerella succinigenes]|uniref:FeoB-associated Cys-rich membrane protein n=1 Tax=Hallerella succinigenes TaxID=1896222 RepID=A0A2M9A554_9BACT|nr:hypothetical protein BGX16_0705 [Hallerella succinigenes]